MGLYPKLRVYRGFDHGDYMTWTHQNTPTAVEIASNAASISQVLGAGQAVGDLVICQYTGDNNGSGTDPGVASVSDDRTMTWTPRPTSWFYNTTALQGVGAADCDVSSTLTSTVTVSYTGWTSGVADFAGIYCSRYRNSAGSGWSFDQAKAAGGNSASPQVSSTTPANDNALCHSQVTDGATETKPTGWTDRVTVTAGNNNATADLIQTTKTATTATWAITSGLWVVNLLIYNDAAPPAVSYKQEHSRWFNDDGSESTATPFAAEDTQPTLAPGAAMRLREQINITGTPPSIQVTLQVKRADESDSFWESIYP